jgi:uncharacterized membrane protein
MPDNRRRLSIVQQIARIGLGAALAFAGISHLSWARVEFLAQVPPWVPLNPNLVVILSGIVEISLGLALVFLNGHRIQLGWLAAAFFVLVFPGNVAQMMYHRNAFTLNTDRARIIRLFFQPLLILWALWSTERGTPTAANGVSQGSASRTEVPSRVSHNHRRFIFEPITH